MDANRALAPSLVLEFKQERAARHGSAGDTKAWRRCATSASASRMDHVTDLRMEPRELAERGIRFVKVPATLLLGQAGAPSGDIHAADLSDLLGRFGISLIAERIEAESAGGRPARLRRALRPGLPVLAAASGARRGAADGDRADAARDAGSRGAAR